MNPSNKLDLPINRLFEISPPESLIPSCVEFSPVDPDLLLIGTTVGTVHALNVSSRSFVAQTPQELVKSIKKLVWAPMNIVAVVYENRTIVEILEVITNDNGSISLKKKEFKKYPISHSPFSIQDVTFVDDGTGIKLCSCASNNIVVWDIQSEEHTPYMYAKSSGETKVLVQSLCFGEKRGVRFLIAGCSDFVRTMLLSQQAEAKFEDLPDLHYHTVSHRPNSSVIMYGGSLLSRYSDRKIDLTYEDFRNAANAPVTIARHPLMRVFAIGDGDVAKMYHEDHSQILAEVKFPCPIAPMQIKPEGKPKSTAGFNVKVSFNANGNLLVISTDRSNQLSFFATGNAVANHAPRGIQIPSTVPEVSQPRSPVIKSPAPILIPSSSLSSSPSPSSSSSTSSTSTLTTPLTSPLIAKEKVELTKHKHTAPLRKVVYLKLQPGIASLDEAGCFEWSYGSAVPSKASIDEAFRSISTFEVSANSVWIMLAAGDLKVYDARVTSQMGTKVHTLTTGSKFADPKVVVTAIAYHPTNNNIYVVGFSNGTVRMIISHKEEMSTPASDSSRVLSLAFSPKLILSLHANGKVCMFDFEGKRRILDVEVGPASRSVSFTPKYDRFIIASNHDLALYAVDAPEKESSYALPDKKSIITSSCVFDENTICCTTDRPSVIFLRSKDMTLAEEIELPVDQGNPTSISPAKERLLIGTSKGSVYYFTPRER